MTGRVSGWFLSAGVALASVFCVGGSAIAQQMGGQPDFGSPPSGEIPIIFNDHHVYAKPDRLRANRVLAALVKDGTILVPLRSLFEQTGATVSYDPATKTVDITKPGADVKVTVGKPIVTINGEDRPLDVPPEMYRGSIVVPLRVISEGMGAYVQWLPDRRTVVVRYNPAPSPTPVPATPPPPPPVKTPPPPPPATPPPPKATPVPEHYEAFVVGDYNVSPTIDNELSPGNKGSSSYNIKGAIEFPFVGDTWMIAADYRTQRYAHNANLGAGVCAAGTAGCNTVVGHDAIFQPGFCPAPDPGCVTTVGFQNVEAFNGLGQAYVPAFSAQESDIDARLAFQVAKPRVYVGVGYYDKHYNYLGYPNVSGIGFGLQKLPDLDQPFSLYASGWYYPTVAGTYTYPTSVFLGPLSGQAIRLSYGVLKYDVGVSLALGKSPFFLEGGYAAEHFSIKTNAPSATQISSPYVGLGLHI
jgi:hypothetical protein